MYIQQKQTENVLPKDVGRWGIASRPLPYLKGGTPMRSEWNLYIQNATLENPMSGESVVSFAVVPSDVRFSQ